MAHSRSSEGDITAREAGHRGGQKVRKLIKEGEAHEQEQGGV